MTSHWSTSNEARQLLLDDIEATGSPEIAQMLLENNAPPEVWDRTLKTRFYTTRYTPKECFDASRAKSINAHFNRAWALPRITWCFEHGHREEGLEWLAAGWENLAYVEDFDTNAFVEKLHATPEEWSTWWKTMKAWNGSKELLNTTADILLTPAICNGLAHDNAFIEDAKHAIKMNALSNILSVLNDREVLPLDDKARERLSPCNIVEHLAASLNENRESFYMHGKYAYKNIHSALLHLVTPSMLDQWISTVEKNMHKANDAEVSLYLYECVMSDRHPHFNSKSKKQLKQIEQQLKYWKPQSRIYALNDDTSKELRIPGILWHAMLEKISTVSPEYISMFTNVFAHARSEDKQKYWDETFQRCNLPENKILNVLKNELAIQVSRAQRQTEDSYAKHMYWLVDRIIERSTVEEAWAFFQGAINAATDENREYPLAFWRAAKLKIGYPNPTQSAFINESIKDECLRACIHALDHNNGLSVDQIQGHLLPLIKKDSQFVEQWTAVHMNNNSRESEQKLTEFYIELLCKEKGLNLSLDNIRNAMEALGSQFDSKTTLSAHVTTMLLQHEASRNSSFMLPTIFEP